MAMYSSKTRRGGSQIALTDLADKIEIVNPPPGLLWYRKKEKRKKNNLR